MLSDPADKASSNHECIPNHLNNLLSMGLPWILRVPFHTYWPSAIPAESRSHVLARHRKHAACFLQNSTQNLDVIYDHKYMVRFQFELIDSRSMLGCSYIRICKWNWIIKTLRRKSFFMHALDSINWDSSFFRYIGIPDGFACSFCKTKLVK